MEYSKLRTKGRCDSSCLRIGAGNDTDGANCHFVKLGCTECARAVDDDQSVTR